MSTLTQSKQTGVFKWKQYNVASLQATLSCPGFQIIMYKTCIVVSNYKSMKRKTFFCYVHFNKSKLKLNLQFTRNNGVTRALKAILKKYDLP